MKDQTSLQLPLITVVVPVKSEAKFIKETLAYITGQDYPSDRLEILVVDGFSDDGTREIVNDVAAADPRVRLLDNPVRLSSAGRNIGARAARGDIVLYIDGHVYIDNRDLLKNVAALMYEKEVRVLSRPQILDTPENTFLQRAVSLARKSVIGHGLDSTIYTRAEKYVDPTSSGAGYRREVFDTVGYFDESFDAAEDVDFNYRVAQAGYQSYTSPKLAVYYYPRASLSALFKQMKRYGTGRFRFVKKHPGALSAGSLAPTALLLMLALLLILAPWISLKPFAALVIVYLLTILIGSLAVAIRHGFRYFAVLPAVYIAVHFGLGWGFISEALRTIFKGS